MLLSVDAAAQPTPSSESEPSVAEPAIVGLVAGLRIGFSRSDNFRGFPPTAATIEYPGGTGIGYLIGAFGQVPLTPALSGRLVIQLEHSSYNLTSSEMIGYGQSQGQPVEIHSEFQTTVARTTLAAVPTVMYRIPGLPILTRVGLGAEIGIPVYRSFEQKEVIKSNDYVFENGRPVRNEVSGAVPGGISFGLVASISVAFDLSPSVVVGTDIGVGLPITPQFVAEAVGDFSEGKLYENHLSFTGFAGWKLGSSKADSIPPPETGSVVIPCADPNAVRNVSGECVCRPGYHKGADSVCVLTPCDILGLVRNANGDCVEPPRDTCVVYLVLYSSTNKKTAQQKLAQIQSDFPYGKVTLFESRGKKKKNVTYQVGTRCYVSEADARQVISSINDLVLASWQIKRVDITIVPAP